VNAASLAAATPFTTADGSTIRELFGPVTTPARNQSLAEASLPPAGSTERHYHRETEEIYFVLEGAAELEVDGERSRVAAGDAVLIPPGAWHQLVADSESAVRILCCCAPAYRHEDTFFS
jgi:mannose-6-phosphate isomerase-like protein (cupin superfamily)